MKLRCFSKKKSCFVLRRHSLLIQPLKPFVSKQCSLGISPFHTEMKQDSNILIVIKNIMQWGQIVELKYVLWKVLVFIMPGKLASLALETILCENNAVLQCDACLTNKSFNWILLVRAQKKTNFAAIKLFETKKEMLFQKTKMGLG